MKKAFLPFLLLILSLMGAWAQQDAQYTQYMYNTLTVNPAYAGSRGMLSVTGLYRSQWVGLEGAPTSMTFNLHSPISPKVGLGLSIVNDEIGNGTNQDTYFDGVFSYTLSITQNSMLSLGIKAGGHLLNIDFSKLQNYTEDPLANVPVIDQRFSPNFGAGAYFYSDNFYFGASIPNFLKTKHFDQASDTFLASERMNLYLITGYIFDLDSDLKLKPAALLKAVKGAPLQLDLSANLLIREKIYFGAAYRLGSAISALAGIQLSDQFMLGLAYDRETTELGDATFNDGSFEVFLRYEFLTRYKRVITPRFF